MGTRTQRDRPGSPSLFDSVFNAFEVMRQTILGEKLEQSRPDIYLHWSLTDIRVLDFHRVDEIYRQSAKVKAQLQWEPERRLV